MRPIEPVVFEDRYLSSVVVQPEVPLMALPLKSQRLPVSASINCQ